MDETFWQGFCYHFALDYDNFMLFFYKWFSIRGIVKNFNISIPQTPRIHISVPLINDKRFAIHQLSIDSDLSETSLDEVDVQFEGSITPISSSSSCEDIKLINGGSTDKMNLRNTPDIVRTIKRRPNKNFGSKRSLTDNEVDPGFFSDGSTYNSRTAFHKLDELQNQFSKMQKDIAELVQHQLNENSKFEITSIFQPIMSSSPSSKTYPIAPPPPCLPPPPPAPPTPISWKKSKNDMKLKHFPDMSDVMKEISTVKLRPVRQNELHSQTSNFSFNPRLPLRSVTKHESIIADAMRERFMKLHLLSEDDTSADTTDEWHNYEANSSWNNANNSQSNVGRLLLRKVDRSQLPLAVSQDLVEFAMREEL